MAPHPFQFDSFTYYFTPTCPRLSLRKRVLDKQNAPSHAKSVAKEVGETPLTGRALLLQI